MIEKVFKYILVCFLLIFTGIIFYEGGYSRGIKNKSIEYITIIEYIEKDEDTNIEQIEEFKIKMTNPDNENILIKTNLTPDELKQGLKYKLKDYAEYFIMAEEETGVSAIFLSTLAAWESGWGRYPNKNNNLFGWNDNVYYNNPEDSIIPTAKKIKEYYLSEDGKYFNGYGIEHINIEYNGKEYWYNGMIEVMGIICNDISLTLE